MNNLNIDDFSTIFFENLNNELIKVEDIKISLDKLIINIMKERAKEFNNIINENLESIFRKLNFLAIRNGVLCKKQVSENSIESFSKIEYCIENTYIELIEGKLNNNKDSLFNSIDRLNYIPIFDFKVKPLNLNCENFKDVTLDFENKKIIIEDDKILYKFIYDIDVEMTYVNIMSKRFDEDNIYIKNQLKALRKILLIESDTKTILNLSKKKLFIYSELSKIDSLIESI
ncbi:hypothetical protein [Clostridium thermobutyricum]|uniref:hypothetical protein n=1 Tax=Clostridium thermobutyricum TaxID=29372 RepID=UPI0029433C27|nr:hypothetical protein [Clostridium thermobutyricum]